VAPLGSGEQLSLRIGKAHFLPPGHARSGDLEVVEVQRHGGVVAVVDGLGHGDSAARAAETAAQTIRAHVGEPLMALVQRCHVELRHTRGVVMSIALIDLENTLLSWLGVGNVRAVLCRPDSAVGPRRQELLLRSGVVGAQLPPLRLAVTPLVRGDTLIFATDGIHAGFADAVNLGDKPQPIADRILNQHFKGNDDALVLVARYLSVRHE